MNNILQSVQILLQSKKYQQLIELVKANSLLLKSPDVCHMYGFALRQVGALQEATKLYNKATK